MELEFRKLETLPPPTPIPSFNFDSNFNFNFNFSNIIQPYEYEYLLFIYIYIIFIYIYIYKNIRKVTLNTSSHKPNHQRLSAKGGNYYDHQIHCIESMFLLSSSSFFSLNFSLSLTSSISLVISCTFSLFFSLKASRASLYSFSFFWQV